MSQRITLYVRVRLLSDTIFGACFSVPGGEDIAVCEDSKGYPYLKGSTLKGLLRESLENWVVWTSGSETDVDELMGVSGWDGLTDDRRIQLSEFQVQSPPASPEECYETRAFTSLTDAGTVESGTLRMASCVRKGMTFVGEVHCACEDEILVKSALTSIKWVGTMRSRGFGRVQFTVESCVEQSAATQSLTAAACIRYRLHTDSPVLITDLARSKDNSYETRGYIPGSAIRGLIVGNLAKDKQDWFAIHRTELLSDNIRFLAAVPAADKMAAAEIFLGGGTNFETPMSEALRLMQEEGFENADVVFITDGQCTLSNEYLEQLRAEQAARRFTVTGILLDKGKPGRTFSLKEFCQDIYRTSELTGEEVVGALVRGRV